jgi:hypothetical protein
MSRDTYSMKDLVDMLAMFNYALSGGKGWQFVPERMKAQHGVLFTTMKHLLQSLMYLKLA